MKLKEFSFLHLKIFFGKYDFVLLLFALIPLFFLNVKATHDWGDDFAQYIHQAELVVLGVSQTQTGYIFNELNSVVGPPVYPVGFPILLAPVYAIFGNSIPAFLYVVSFFLIGFSLVCFFYFKRYFTPFYSGLAVLFLVYNPWMIQFKSEIGSDIPFLFFSMLCLFLSEKYIETGLTFRKSLMYGLFVAIAILIRNIGVVLVISLIAGVFLQIVYNKSVRDIVFLKKQFVGVGIVLFMAIIIPFTVNFILGAPTTETFSYFTTLYDFNRLVDSIYATTDYYFNQTHAFFQVDTYRWLFLSLVTTSTCIGLAFIGLVISCLSRISVKELFLFGYLFLVLSFSDTTQGFRYILPVLPILTVYILTGLFSIKLETKVNKSILVFAVLCFLLIQYIPAAIKMASTVNNMEQGPQEPQAIEAFDFIDKHTPENAVIIFQKPRALALYTHRKSLALGYQESETDIKSKINRTNASYILRVADYQNQALNNYVNSNLQKLKLMWTNQRFTLYQIVK